MTLISKIGPYRRRYGLRRTVEKIISVPYLWLAQVLRLRFVRSLYRVRLRANFGDQTFQSYVRAWYGFYFSDFLCAFNRKFYFLDIGANQGLYSIIAAKNSSCNRVWAFEPVAGTFEYLSDNVGVNCPVDKVECVNFAISNADTERPISISKAHSGGASLEHASSQDALETIRCMSARSVDQLIVMSHDGVEVIVKIDTEGHEPVVIGELRKTNMWKSVTHLFAEVNSDWVNQGALKELLEREGFVEIHRIGGGRHNDVMWQRVPS